jgi:hypothetical protein
MRDEVRENINELEEFSKASVDTVGEGFDAYYMMSKDLENKIDGINNRTNTLSIFFVEMTT